MKASEVLAVELLSHLVKHHPVSSCKTPEEVTPFIEEAKADIALHTRRDELPSYFESKIKKLAKIRILKVSAENDRLKNKSYSEGVVSKSETYLTIADYEKQEAELLSSLNAHRRCRVVTE